MCITHHCLYQMWISKESERTKIESNKNHHNCRSPLILQAKASGFKEYYRE